MKAILRTLPLLLIVAVASCASSRDTPASSATDAIARVRALEGNTTVAADVAGQRASVALPGTAAEPTTIRAAGSDVSVDFTLRDASGTTLQRAGDFAFASHALRGADLVQHIRQDGIEDYFLFGSRPAKEQISYEIEKSTCPPSRASGSLPMSSSSSMVTALRACASRHLTSWTRTPAVSAQTSSSRDVPTT